MIMTFKTKQCMHFLVTGKSHRESGWFQSRSKALVDHPNQQDWWESPAPPSTQICPIVWTGSRQCKKRTQAQWVRIFLLPQGQLSEPQTLFLLVCVCGRLWIKEAVLFFNASTLPVKHISGLTWPDFMPALTPRLLNRFSFPGYGHCVQ